jgi:PIN domain nuclease of toxin-antitoxin system
MKYLLDTHALIWVLENSTKISERLKSICRLPENDIFISSVSLWEIAIKMNLGKLDLKISFDDLLNAITGSNFEVLQVEDKYLKLLFDLPNIHKDPFDRLIITTAIADSLTIITADENIQKYDVKYNW